MTDSQTILYVLLVEDDEENLSLLLESLPREIEGFRVEWEPCDSFERAEELVAIRRFDVVVTDIYRDRTDTAKGVDPEDEQAKNIVTAIRSRRFCPVIAFTDGSAPQSFVEGPFVKIVDKSKGDQEILASLGELLATGVPEIARKLHDELDRTSGSYLWEFLEAHWDDFESSGVRDQAVLERLVRRRAAMQLGRLDPMVGDPAELQVINAVEYYIYPPISDEFRLGEIIRNKHDQAVRVIMTPHCHLTVQQGDERPRADHILTLKTFPAKQILKKEGATWSGKDSKKASDLRRRTKIEADLGKPRGRYCFLPGFLDIPDLYCDLLQAESISLETITQDFEKLAVLDTPFAEALQSCFSRFYSAVGLPSLDTKGLKDLMG